MTSGVGLGTKPRFSVGQAVQRKNQPEAIGLVLEPRVDVQLGTFKYVVQFPGERRVVPEDGLQPVVICATPWEALQNQAFSGKDQFVCNLTYHRLRYPPTRIAHSFATARTQFYPHQFKPLLKFLENPSKRLLIADDVGLGKTIEAGYIMRELDARQGRLERILVVVPARLTLKWKREMRDRFGEHFEVVSASDLLRQADRLRRNREAEPFRWITSYESARKEEVWTALLETQMSIDLVICDEAHRMRNPEALQHKLGTALAECADSLLFLSATPVQTSLENLWILLRLLSPDEFQEWPVFEHQMMGNRLLLKAQTSLAQRPPDLEQARGAYSSFLRMREYSSVVEGDFAKSIETRLEGEVMTLQAIDLQSDIALLSPVGHIICRTRKVEALPNRPVREAGWLSVDLGIEERNIYDSVEDLCQLSWPNSSPSSWGFQMSLLMAYRITASCIPAAMSYFREKLDSTPGLTTSNDPLETEADDSEEFGELTAWTALGSRNRFEQILSEYESGEKSDSKVLLLVDTLNKLWTVDDEKPRRRRKVVLFSYFRRTLQYLSHYLSARGIENRMIHGLIPVEEREVSIEEFLTREDTNILLTSEVGGEGIDLQQACVVVNYDLPWNPMIVEQRIGRVDRIGQESPKIYVFNLVVAQSIEERILERLLRRIELFRESIGELDSIIGNQIEEITKRALTGELVGEELERVLEQEGDALQRRVQEARKVLSQVDGLLAADQALVQEINAVVGERQLPSDRELLLFLNRFLATRYPGCQLPMRAAKDVTEVDLHGRLVADLELRASDLGDDTLFFARRIETAPVPLTLSREAGYRHQRAELIHLQHPLCRFAVTELLRDGLEGSGAFVLRAPSGPLPAGEYAFLIALLHISSYRPNTRMVCILVNRHSGEVIAEPERAVAALIHILDHGQDCDPPLMAPDEAEQLKTVLLDSLGHLTESWDGRERKIDQARREQQHASRAASFEFRYRSAVSRLAHLEKVGAKDFAIRMANARVEKSRKDRDAFLVSPTGTTWGGIEHEEIAVGLLIIGDPS